MQTPEHSLRVHDLDGYLEELLLVGKEEEEVPDHSHETRHEVSQ